MAHKLASVVDWAASPPWVFDLPREIIRAMAFNRLACPPNRDRAIAMAQKYVWWKTPTETMAEPGLLLAQMMTMGTLEDVQWMLSFTSSDELRAVLGDPPVGVFNGRSWTYWHRRLNGEPIPPLPTRRVAA